MTRKINPFSSPVRKRTTDNLRTWKAILFGHFSFERGANQSSLIFGLLPSDLLLSLFSNFEKEEKVSSPSPPWSGVGPFLQREMSNLRVARRRRHLCQPSSEIFCQLSRVEFSSYPGSERRQIPPESLPNSAKQFFLPPESVSCEFNLDLLPH